MQGFSLSGCSAGDKNHISVPARIASVYIRISLVLFLLQHHPANSIQLPIHPEQRIFLESFISRLQILCEMGIGMASIPRVCCISLSRSVLCLNSPDLPSSFVQVFTNFFSLKQAATAATSFLSSDFIFNSGSLMKRLSSRRHRCTKIPFFHDNFP